MAVFHLSLRRFAQSVVEAEARKVERLHKEILDLEKRTAEQKMALQLARSAVDRFDSFEPDIDGNLQCPSCWIAHDIRSDLTPIPSDTGADLFRCKNCHAEISVED